MSGQDASSERRQDFFTHDPALAEDLDGWHDAPEPSWLAEEEAEGVNGATAHIPAYDLGPATESFVVDLTGPQAMVGAPVEPSVDAAEATGETTVSRHAAPFASSSESTAPPVLAEEAAAGRPASAGRAGRTPCAARSAASDQPGSRPRGAAHLQHPPCPRGQRDQPGRVAHRGDDPAVPEGTPAERLAQGSAESHWRQAEPRPVTGRPPSRRAGDEGPDTGDRLSPARGDQPEGRGGQDDDHGRPRGDVRPAAT